MRSSAHFTDSLIEHWKTLESRLVLDTPWMRVRADRVRVPAVEDPETYHVVEYPDWSCTVCLDEAGRLVLVEQYRHGLGEICLGLPAGIIDHSESPLAAAKRELMEETGYEADSWLHLANVAPNPSKQNNRAYVFVARGARPAEEQRLDRTEQIRVRLMNPPDALIEAEAGQIGHAIHVMALFWADRRGLLPATEE